MTLSIWVIDSGLREFEPFEDYFEGQLVFGNDDTADVASGSNELEKARRVAFHQDAMQFQTPAYWSNYIKSKSAAKKLESKIGRKRKRSQVDEEDDEEIAILDIRSTASASTKSTTPPLAPKKRKRRLGSGPLLTPGPSSPSPLDDTRRGTSKARVIDLGDEGEGEESDQDNLFVGQAKCQRALVPSQDEEDDDSGTDLARIRKKNIQGVKDNPPT